MGREARGEREGVRVPGTKREKRKDTLGERSRPQTKKGGRGVCVCVFAYISLIRLSWGDSLE